MNNIFEEELELLEKKGNCLNSKESMGRRRRITNDPNFSMGTLMVKVLLLFHGRLYNLRVE